MLNYATLNQARQGLQASEQKHHQQAAELYLQGRALTREGLQDPINKEKLKKAAGCFARGLQLDYRNPSNYLGMAFLFLFLGQAEQAIPYIQSALEIAPESPLGQELMSQAQADLAKRAGRQANREAPSRPALPPSGSAPIDYDALYDQTEADLMLFLKEILSDEVMAYRPLPDSKRLKLLQQKHAAFQARNHVFEKQLTVLEQELESNELRQLLLRVEQALHRIDVLERLFEQFIDIQLDIQKHLDLTQDVISESQATDDPEDIPILEENLNVLLDHCDSVADRLEQIEAERCDISPLQAPYQRYTEQLEQFQDMLEETIERLKG